MTHRIEYLDPAYKRWVFLQLVSLPLPEPYAAILARFPDSYRVVPN